jgi:hypothetical protein
MLSLAPRTGNDTELNKTLLMTGFQYQHIVVCPFSFVHSLVCPSKIYGF